MTEFEIVATQIENATTPHDLFGPVAEDHARTMWLQMMKIVHPDKVDPKDQARANAVTAKLNVLWEQVKDSLATGIILPIRPAIFALATRRYCYNLTQVTRGTTCGIFSAVIQDKKGNVAHGIVKIPHSEADNDLIEREIVALTKIKDKLKTTSQEEQDNARFVVPRIFEVIKHADGKKILSFVYPPGADAGWYDLFAIKKQYPDGLTSRQIAFIGNRLFESLSFAHVCGITHNAITPNHVIIHAEKHYGQVIDWTCSGNTLPYLAHKEFLSADVYVTHRCSPREDVYAAAKCLIFLAPKQLKSNQKGGLLDYHYEDIEYIDLEEPLVEFLNRCIQPRRRYRPANAIVATQEFREVQKQVFGERKFVELTMP
jgi:hypothetical protein